MKEGIIFCPARILALFCKAFPQAPIDDRISQLMKDPDCKACYSLMMRKRSNTARTGVRTMARRSSSNPNTSSQPTFVGNPAHARTAMLELYSICISSLFRLIPIGVTLHLSFFRLFIKSLSIYLHNFNI